MSNQHRSKRTGTIVRLTASACFAFAGCSSPQTAHAADPPLVETRQGVVQGVIEDGLVVFKGIPYAAPPVGPLRWKRPQAPATWDDVRPATAFGPGCPMFDGSRMAEGRWLARGGVEMFVDIPAAPGATEDCLYLNVWAPANAERAAVMVWIQPQLASSFPFFDGTAFARDGVVFVSLDYRMLTLGNFAHPALTAEAGPDEPLCCFATLDHLAALRWVDENIAAFGGDRDNVTVFGLSAGGAATLALLTTPDARGLIDKAIVQSGFSWGTLWSLAQAERLGSVFATHAGLPGAEATAEQLRALPLGALPQAGFGIIDGRFRRDSTTTAIEEGRILDVPLMIGWTDFDGSSLRGTAPEDIVTQASDELLAAYASDGLSGADLGYRMYTDSHVGAPARWVTAKTSEGAPSYLYLYSYVMTARRGQVRGAAHGDDLAHVFDIWDKALPMVPRSEEDRAATRMMHGCWVSFAKTGEPSCDGAPEWPRYTQERDELMELGLNPIVRRSFRKAQLDAQEAAWRSGADESATEAEAALRSFEEVGLRGTQ